MKTFCQRWPFTIFCQKRNPTQDGLLEQINTTLDSIKTIMTEQKNQLDDLLKRLADSEAAAKVRDQAILDKLTALQNTPPAPEDLSAELQTVKDLITTADSIGVEAPVPAPEAPAAPADPDPSQATAAPQ